MGSCSDPTARFHKPLKPEELVGAVRAMLGENPQE